MGNGGSKLEKALAEIPDDERYYGLENFGNTCYCNSVIQALYFCKPFRERILKYAAQIPAHSSENLLNCLADLFVQVGCTKVAGRTTARLCILAYYNNVNLYCRSTHQRRRLGSSRPASSSSALSETTSFSVATCTRCTLKQTF